MKHGFVVTLAVIYKDIYLQGKYHVLVLPLFNGAVYFLCHGPDQDAMLRLLQFINRFDNVELTQYAKKYLRQQDILRKCFQDV